MANTYKTHYTPNPCGTTGFCSNFTAVITEVTCKNCISKNEIPYFEETQKLMKCNFKYVCAGSTYCKLPRPSLSEPRCAEEDCILMKILKSMEESQ